MHPFLLFILLLLPSTAIIPLTLYYIKSSWLDMNIDRITVIWAFLALAITLYYGHAYTQNLQDTCMEMGGHLIGESALCDTPEALVDLRHQNP